MALKDGSLQDYERQSFTDCVTEPGIAARRVKVCESVLPDGAATESTLQSIDAGIPVSLGQKVKAESMPVTIASDQAPPDFITIVSYLTNGGSNLMNVNGSVTPVKFNLAPTAGLTYFVHSISLMLSDGGTMDYTDFGSIVGPLTNGLLFSVKSKGSVYNQFNAKDNIDLSLCVRADPVSIGSATSTGFFNDVDFYLGTMTFENPIILQNSTSDEIYITVRDNLTALDHLRATVKYRRAS